MAYAAPSHIRLNNIAESLFQEVMPDGTDLRISWYSPYKTFDVQWRFRRRYTPSQAAASFDSQAWDADWEDIAWQGSDSTIVTPTKVGDRCEMATAIHLDQSQIHTYDYMEMQIRVRAHNSSDGARGEWGAETASIAYRPTGTLSAERNDDGSVTFEVTFTNWERTGNTARVREFYTVPTASRGKGTKISDRPLGVVEMDNQNRFTVPFEYVGRGKTVVPTIGITTIDGGSMYFTEAITIADRPGRHESAIPPEIGWNVEDGQLTIWRSDGQLDSVLFAAQWTDAMGNYYADTLEGSIGHIEDIGEDGWLATFADPPFGVPITVRNVARRGAQWGAAEATIDPIVGGNVLTAPGEDPIRLDAAVGEMQAVDRSIKQDVETVQLDGRSMPVARYGARRTPTITANAVVGEGHLSLVDAERLTNPHDWTLRTYDGMRCKVAIESVSTQHVAKGWRSVQISMSEVD